MNKGQLIEAVQKNLGKDTSKAAAEAAEAAELEKKIRELKLNLQPASPSVYIVRFCRELDLPGNVESAAINILNQAIEAELTSGRGPTGVAAASISLNGSRSQ